MRAIRSLNSLRPLIIPRLQDEGFGRLSTDLATAHDGHRREAVQIFAKPDENSQFCRHGFVESLLVQSGIRLKAKIFTIPDRDGTMNSKKIGG